jgi:hypothetical protein
VNASISGEKTSCGSRPNKLLKNANVTFVPGFSTQPSGNRE